MDNHQYTPNTPLPPATSDQTSGAHSHGAFNDQPRQGSPPQAPHHAYQHPRQMNPNYSQGYPQPNYQPMQTGQQNVQHLRQMNHPIERGQHSFQHSGQNQPYVFPQSGQLSQDNFNNRPINRPTYSKYDTPSEFMPRQPPYAQQYPRPSLHHQSETSWPNYMNSPPLIQFQGPPKHEPFDPRVLAPNYIPFAAQRSHDAHISRQEFVSQPAVSRASQFLPPSLNPPNVNRNTESVTPASTDRLPFPASKLHELDIARAENNVSEAAEESSDDEHFPGAETPEAEQETDAEDVDTGSKKRKGGPKSSETQPRKRRKKKGRGARGGWSKGMKLGPRQAIDPGAEFNQLHREANNAFIDQDTDKALELILKAIAINPEIYAAHSLLSEIFFTRGEDDKATAALFTGAHSIPTDPDVWERVAHACLDHATGDKQRALQQASYCYSRIVHSDPKNWDARFKRASLSKQIQNYRKATTDCETILEAMPRNSSVLRLLAEICLETRDLDKAKAMYEETLDYYRENGFEGEEDFTWADVLVYGQLLAQEEPPDLALSNAISTLERLSRWLLGRQDETYWDEYTEDDREWDSEDEPRRILATQFVPGKYSPDAYGTGLPLELRARLGILRLKQEGMLEEALAHFEWLEPDASDEEANVFEYPDLFLEVAQALHDVGEHNQALRYLETLKDVKAYEHSEFWVLVAANSYLCGDKDQAMECYEEAKAVDDDCIEARTQLSRMFADLGDKEQAMENAREAVRIVEDTMRITEKRKYERKEHRLAREGAEKALKQAYKMPGTVTLTDPVNELEAKLQAPPKKRTWKTRKTLAREAAKAAAQEAARAVADEKADAKKQRQQEREQKREEKAKAKELREQNAEAKKKQKEDAEEQKSQERSVEARKDATPTAEAEKKKRPVKRVAKPRPAPLPKPKRMTAEEREAHRTETINRLYEDLVDNTEDMRTGDEVARNTWMDCADSIIIDFKTNRTFYPKEAHQASTIYDREVRNANSRKKWEQHPDAEEVDQDFAIPSVESSMPKEYRGIAFSDWLDVFLEYALLLAHDPDLDAQRRSYPVIKSASDCVVWSNDSNAMLQIHITYFACAMAMRDTNTLFNVVLRWFIQTYKFCTDSYRLFAALNFFFPYASEKGGKESQMSNAHFRTGPAQKFMFRQIMSHDANLPENYNPDGFGSVPEFMRIAKYQLQQDGDGLINGEVGTPDEMDAVLLTLYANILYAGGSFPSALSYLFRAHSLDPKNPVVLLTIALSYMHELLKRQIDNRHMYLLQGWAFFEEYADARHEWAKAKDDNELLTVIEREIEFNRARCWHMLGMSDLAIRSYEKMLSIGESDADYTMEAAYAMQTIYALSGNAIMARDITEKYLVV
ncbi:transcription factor TFIIIC subunit tfc4 [Elasticomyces elasticus]|uniref:Transcription factor TFIIIC subunit tfc4 n=1 Tax=Exophiala sideris TaxID=1016849 RepID=A0ABR0JQE6_9EURO|nr:transcription factor TFIIIC subunit tfc4 [Elasticomyces elasticus]KAK5039652.1 transcription factor TFIIIC subunit tfc4 [Exophiala sideris]KAK5041204.1 transcription factor TFIIIC subunit tfc4 [Exophiala sideris]KAK5068029.1 transcription factor TFIIIC subunit tfc4 [Exophiala sideris]KAK5187331.1 transcription factor TFIIIC subunit tfc4 [Eurotiomycetes sp. CCFEE 6388]